MFQAFLASILIVAPHISFGPAIQGRNVIEGRVTTADNRPLDNARVFLQNDGYSQVDMKYTDASGRFRFVNIASGTYYVVVEPGGSGYARQSQRIEAAPFSSRAGRPGGEIFRVDFVLGPAKSEIKSIDKPADVIFYQKVPSAAKNEYLRGTRSLEKNNFEAAVRSLRRAIEIFPDYYDALADLGIAHMRRGEFALAVLLLERAVEVNRDGWASFYYLGVAHCQLNHVEEGIKALRRAVDLNPDSVNASMRLGITLSRDEQTQPEAIHLLKKVARLAGDRVPDVYLYLASLYGKRGQYAESADALESYLRLFSSVGTEQRERYRKLIDQLRQKTAGLQKSN